MSHESDMNMTWWTLYDLYKSNLNYCQTDGRTHTAPLTGILLSHKNPKYALIGSTFHVQKLYNFFFKNCWCGPHVGKELMLAYNYHYIHYIPPVIMLSLIAFIRDWFCVTRILKLNRKPHRQDSRYSYSI